jgi:hypothetical protein
MTLLWPRGRLDQLLVGGVVCPSVENTSSTSMSDIWSVLWRFAPVCSMSKLNVEYLLHFSTSCCSSRCSVNEVHLMDPSISACLFSRVSGRLLNLYDQVQLFLRGYSTGINWGDISAIMTQGTAVIPDHINATTIYVKSTFEISVYSNEFILLILFNLQ